MSEPPPGRRVSTPEEADILAETGEFREARAHVTPEGGVDLERWSVRVERRYSSRQRPYVVHSLDKSEAIVTIMVPKKTPKITR
jgi:hypothetical protein